MTTYSQVAVSLGAASGLPQDAIVNTFAIRSSAPIDSLGSGIGLAVAYAFNTPGSVERLSYFIGEGVSRSTGACKVQIYDVGGHLDGSPHGSPVAEDAFTMGAVNTTSDRLPDEVAMKITLRGVDWQDAPVERADGSDPGVARDRPLQRKTGGMFIGPLRADPVFADGHVRPGTGLQTLLLDFIEMLRDQLDANDHTLCVWSRADAAFYTAEDAFVDNAFDTQRRRGPAPTGRTFRQIF